jgi:hypothetical protein
MKCLSLGSFEIKIKGELIDDLGDIIDGIGWFCLN